MAATNDGIGGTVHSIMKDVEQLFRSELHLARIEARRELAVAVKAAVLLLLGVGFGLLAVAFALFALLFVLRGHLPSWVAALLVGVLAAILAAALLQAARAHAPSVLQSTVSAVKEDLEWTKQQRPPR